MKETRYILSKLIKKQTIPLLLLTALMVLFFVNLFNRPVAYASELIASVQCNVNVVDGEKVDCLASDYDVISNVDEAIINFSDVNIKLNSSSRIEIDYVVENISKGSCEFKLTLNKEKMNNFKIEYSIDGTETAELTELKHKINFEQISNIKVVVSIDDVCRNAILDGCLNLTFNTIGEN